MSNPPIPEREFYGEADTDNPLSDEDYRDVIDCHIQKHWPPPIPSLDLLCADTKRDADGKPVPFDDDQGFEPGVFALANEETVTIDIHEWCAENGCLDMLEIGK